MPERARFKRRDFICQQGPPTRHVVLYYHCLPKTGFTARTDTNLFSCHGEGSVEPLVEGGHGLEDAGQEEVEERPELGEFVLEGRPCEEEAVRRRVVRVQDHRQLTVMVLHSVTLVYYHVLPPQLFKKKKRDIASFCKLT